ncbi:aldehyde ferredoxin oxidoreductase family protein [Acidaminobacter hydrogenoformans]|uniref:Aldehyde:ferredoxin oxidoreductase n=1 Tax=Acidaminobacter hydrogenoformans DSM 2784 TaxID=1120920 RepID=A0A1G5S4T2_9FIRM|nr:aldehyde ferredoxin oxidoreductase C-terminal domain-containing protein [Acidaminobacter hydrogenoformans]SCZ81167.1 aldehyde:ferredoxin oxidoreductase [Acidaminobacter hydrogenoformans DSM 2784]
MEIKAMKEARTLLTAFDYEPAPVERGYTDRALHINLGKTSVEQRDIPAQVREKFIGGKGYGLRMLWDAVKPSTRWNDPENAIVVAGGPICGITQYPGSGKSLVCTISPMTDMPIDSNVGGYFGPYLKFSGFDAMEITGKSEQEVIIFIDGNSGKVTVETAPLEAVDGHVLAEQMTEMYAEDEEDKKNISVICAGTAANYANIGLLNFSFYDLRRQVARLKQAGRGGIGRVFRDKKIKAVVIRYRGTKGNLNKPVDQSRINKAGIKLHRQIHDLDATQCRMHQIGTANIIEVMDAYDLLPTHNYQYGSHPETHKIASNVFIEKYVTQGMPDGCWYGCSLSCAKAADHFELKTGPYKGHKVTIDGPEYENAAGLGSNCGIFDPELILEANFYCDTYGVDTISFGTITAFAMECYERGLINRENTGGLELTFGNGMAQLELLHQMSRGEGFGYHIGLGVRHLKEYFEKAFGADRAFLEDIGMEQKGLEVSEYLPKESLAQQGGYGLTNKGPQHDEAWLIFMDMVNNQIPTFEDKAEALHYFPMFRTWFGLMGLCKLPWNDTTPADNGLTDEPAKIPEHVQNYVDLYNGVTGASIDKHELIRQSERVYNFQRIFNIRMGKGLRVHDAMPYRAMGPVTKEEYLSREERYDKQLLELQGVDPAGKTVEEKIALMRAYRLDQYEKLTDAVYKRRGWTAEGVPTVDYLREIGMDLPEVISVVTPLQG